MRISKVTWIVACAVCCSAFMREADARSFHGGQGSIRYAPTSGRYWYDSDQAWNAGFGAITNPQAEPWKENRPVATVNQSEIYPGITKQGGGENRITVSPVNYGSILNSGGSAGMVSSTGGNPTWAIKKMSDYLGGLQQIALWINETSERVLESGEKIQLSSEQTTYAQRPDKLAVETRTSKSDTRIVYDGKVVTVIDEVKKLYGTIPVQGGLGTVLNTLATDYGMAVPADDLLYKGAFERLKSKIRVAQDLGQDVIDGKPCEHLAFVLDNVDFQIWIPLSDKPLPRRVLIVYKNVPGQPRCMLDITRWETGPLSESVFTVTLPTDAKQIKILPRQ